MIKILIIDDEPQILEITKIFLERTGNFDVYTGDSATAGLMMLENCDFDAVISDYEMSGMNGLDFLKKIRMAGNTIPFVIFTGRSREDVVIEALNCGADYYIQKGGDPKAQFAELTHKILLAVDKKRSEKALSEANEYKNRLIEAHIDPLLTIDSHYRIMDLNSAMEILSGYKKHEIEGKDIAELFHDRKEVQYALETANQNSNLRDFPLEIVNRQGVIIPILFHATPYLNEDNEFLGFFTEFHEYKQKNKELFQEATSNDEFFLDILMHDSRNMVAAELGYLEIVREEDETQDFWKKRMENLTGNIIHLISNIESMRHSKEICCDLKAIDLRPLICREAGSFTDLKISIEEFNCKIMANDLLSPVFYNLFSNVRKHCGEGTNVRISVIETYRQVSIFFEDSGDGITGDLIDEFNGGDYIDCEKSGKRGLGLTLIRNIIKNCSGNIIIRPDSNDVPGTKFIISLKKHLPCENKLLLNEIVPCLKNR
ncbi:MAG: response regulator [Methanomicrobiaceae archaeon]|nr:response regulator [Methanomicrobiaceae archaeon]